MNEIIEPYTFSQFLIDTYYDDGVAGKRDFIRMVQARFPKLDVSLIETFYLVIDFMALGIGK